MWRMIWRFWRIRYQNCSLLCCVYELTGICWFRFLCACVYVFLPILLRCEVSFLCIPVLLSVLWLWLSTSAMQSSAWENSSLTCYNCKRLFVVVFINKFLKKQVLLIFRLINLFLKFGLTKSTMIAYLIS